MRTSFVLSRWDINPMTNIFIRDTQRRDIQRRGKGHITMETEIAAMWPRVKEHLVFTKSWRKQRIDQREHSPATTLISGLGHSGWNCKRIHFSCFKPPNLW